MALPSLAYFAIHSRNITYLREAVQQCETYYDGDQQREPLDGASAEAQACVVLAIVAWKARDGRVTDTQDKQC